jgi:putative resolvase
VRPIKPKEMAKRCGVTVQTLQRWDRENYLNAKRTLTNRRYYTEDQIKEVLERRET